MSATRFAASSPGAPTSSSGKATRSFQLNIGNPGLFGLRTPETMRLAMIENLPSAEAYCNQKGIFPAREAVVMQQQERGVHDVDADHVFMGNGVSELIDLTLRGAPEPRRRGADPEPRTIRCGRPPRC